MRDIYLHGTLGEKYGYHHQFEVQTVSETIRAFHANYRGFVQDFKQGSYQLIRGEQLTGEQLDERCLHMWLGGQPLHIIPVVEGSGGDSKGIITTVLGVIMIAAAFIIAPPVGGSLAAMSTTAVIPGISAAIFSASSLALLGGALVLGGLSQLLTPVPKVDSYDERGTDKKQSYLFNGQINRAEQGGAIPITYGIFEIGSIVVSAGISLEKADKDPGDDDDDPPGLDYFDFVVTCGEHAHCDPSTTLHIRDNSSFYMNVFADVGYYISSVKYDDREILGDPNWTDEGYLILINHNINISVTATINVS